MNQSKPEVFQKRKLSFNNSTSKNSNNINQKTYSNLSFNSLILTPNMNSTTEINFTNNLDIGKISPNQNIEKLKKNSIVPLLKKNFYTNIFLNLNKTKENEEIINISKNIYTNNSINEENKTNIKHSEKMKGISGTKMPDNNNNLITFNIMKSSNSSSNLKGDFFIDNDLNGNSSIKERDKDSNKNSGFESIIFKILKFFLFFFV
jgi:hypothetical protein